jgi:dihydrofolate synthase/folylpolyglutamate synthase
VLRRLGNPHHDYASILVAGTNGKGSTAAMLSSILEQSGYRTALYTSPHLVDLRERWRIEGKAIDDGLLIESIEAMRDASDRAGIAPTYFEALTLIAFIAFARAKVEIAVLEVGMGGRLDATNVVRPVASVITPVSFDHMEFLGTTIRSIAAEKAGIIHSGSIALTTNDDERVLSVLRRRAAQFDVPFIHVSDVRDSPLAGEFQRRNAALAARTAREIAHRFPQITFGSIERGIASTRWRGRLETVTHGKKTIWIDGGHNPQAAETIARFIETNIPAPRLLVFAIMSDKDATAVTERLFPLFARIVVTNPYPPRALPVAGLVERARAHAPALGIEDPDEAFRCALDSSESSIVITGSLYLAGAAVGFFDKIAADDHH